MAKPEDQDRHEGLSAAQSVAESNQMTLVGVDASIIDPDVIIMEPNAAAPLGAEDVMFLELADLLPDESGEVVLFAGDDVPVNILASEPVTDAEIGRAHV